MINKNDKVKKISYEELAKRVGDAVLMNSVLSAHNFAEEMECVNGEEYYKDDETGEATEYFKDIYQAYAINQSGADYLIDNTDELVYYNSELDTYFWGITHWGTPWSDVYTEIKTY